MELQNEPVRKRRREKERVRVTRACDTCKKKKLRCTGTLPCASCLRNGKPCEYRAEYNRGKLPVVPISQSPMQEGSEVESQHIESTMDLDRSPSVPQSQTLESRNTAEINQPADIPPSRASPDPHQTDLDGHYVGPSSGVSFLNRAQRRLYRYVALPTNAPIFTFGDSPLPAVDSELMLLPPRAEANDLVARYFDFCFPTHRFLHQQHVEGWLDEFYNGVKRSGTVGPGVREKRAVLLMVFAQASESQPPDLDQSSIKYSNNSAGYFAASEKQLTAETGPVRLTSVQARLAQCFYLLSHSRINHCWSLFGTTARLAIAIGLHRARRREPTAGIDHIESECRKRVFWCAYSLDNYLSAALGRPRIFHDDDIDQDLPIVADDSLILSNQILPKTSSAQSIMLAPLYHAKLSIIIGRILHDMYGARKASSQAEVSAAAQHGTELTQWRQEISSFVDSSNVDLLILLYQRQYTVLNLAFYHAQILLYRPFILRHGGIFGNREKSNIGPPSESVDQYINLCLTAAMKIAEITRELCEKRRMYNTFWFTHYYAFSAIMILYVRVIQLATQKDSPEDVFKYLQTGEHAQRDLATSASQSSFVQRYVVVLEELRAEARLAANQNGHHVPETNGAAFSYGHRISDAQIAGRYQGIQSDELEGVPGNTHAQPSFDANSRMDVAGALQGANFMAPAAVMQSNFHRWTEGATEDSTFSPGLFGLAEWEGLDSFAVGGMGELDNLFSYSGE